jgi:23S rRNA (cytidine1920-2'-O)/16S rRNA (cytidine1409-2'-O)-methyltransferase
MRRRLDAELVRRGLVPGRAQARALIEEGRVTVGGAPAAKATRLVDPGEPILVEGPPPRFVGRGGAKLDGAIEEFGLDPTGLRVLDAGASTGGFTDCLLQRGAASVTALDVGHGQLHERLRADPRVEVVERTNVRHVDPAASEPYDAVVADLSFISLTAVLDVLVRSVRPRGWLVLLVKPQFEAGRAEASRGRGVITDPTVWRDTLGRVVDAASRVGASMMGVMVSPLQGADGNTEFLVHLRRDDPGVPSRSDDPAVTGLLDDVVARAEEAG